MAKSKKKAEQKSAAKAKKKSSGNGDVLERIATALERRNARGE